MKQISIDIIIDLQKQATIDWHTTAPKITYNDFLGLVEANHMKNFLLWHEEDRARRDDLGFEHVYRAKRAIDKYNQERNNFMERIDEFIYNLLPPALPPCPLHTETPGMIIDRLSIMTLKQYHIEEETVRTNVSDFHRERCLQRLSIITEQLSDLRNSFQDLIDQAFCGQRTFRINYQLKMYNDPSLNPELYNLSKNC